jgi:transposase
MVKNQIIVESVVSQGLGVRATAKKYGVSPAWVSTLVSRYRAEGPGAFEARSKRLHSNAKATPPAIEDRIIELRKELLDIGTDAGAETIRVHLEREGAVVPSVSTIQRITPSENATDATISQVLRFVAALEEGKVTGASPLFVLDAGYDPIALGDGLSGVNAQALVRISSKRVFHFDPAPPRSGPGRPPRHGARFALSGPETWTTPDGELSAHDPRYGPVNVRVWHGLHPKLTTRGRWGSRARRRSCAAVSFASTSNTCPECLLRG